MFERIIRGFAQLALLALYERAITDGESLWRIARLRRRLEEIETSPDAIDAAFERGYIAYATFRCCTAPRGYA